MPELGDIRYGREIGYIKATRNNRYIWHQCEICGKQRWTQFTNTKPVHSLCKSCGKKGSRNYSWKGGRTIHYGYILVWLDPRDFYYPMVNSRGRVYEHRLIMAKKLGRCLQRWEIVHHKNGIKDDNRPENLEIGIRSDHGSGHAKGYKDGYKKGFLNGRSKQIQALREEIGRLKCT